MHSLCFLSLLLIPLTGITGPDDSAPPTDYLRDDVTIELVSMGSIDVPSGIVIGGCNWGEYIERITIAGAGSVSKNMQVNREGCETENMQSEIDAAKFMKLLRLLYAARFFELDGPYEGPSQPYYQDERHTEIGTAIQFVSPYTTYQLSAKIGTYLKIVEFRHYARVPWLNEIAWLIRCIGGDEVACRKAKANDPLDGNY